MKRKTYRAILAHADTGDVIGDRIAYAWNSTIRASEALVREYARSGHGMHEGGVPDVVVVDGRRTYCRVWTDEAGRKVRATVAEVTA